MTEREAIVERRSIRKYKPIAIPAEKVEALEACVRECNEKAGLHFQLVLNEKEALTGFLSHYGGFKNAWNYIALVGKKEPDVSELCGYYGEKIVLLAQTLGLGTCWVGGTFKKKKTKYQCNEDEKLYLIITIGEPDETRGMHRSKTFLDVSKTKENYPSWYEEGVKAALLAPTAINQQKFTFTYHGENKVSCVADKGPFSIIDLGIVKYHFELGSQENIDWVK